jgi:hypothetical protein
MDDQLEELDFGGENGKVRWIQPELARKWKSWLETNKSRFSSPSVSSFIAKDGYEEDLWNEFFEKNPDTDVEKVALRGEEEGTTLDSRILVEKYKGITNSKDITDDIRKSFAQRSVRFRTSIDGNEGSLHYGMMDNLYHPETVKQNKAWEASLANAKSVNEQYNSTESKPAVNSTASPSRASALNAKDNLPIFLRLGTETQPWGPNHPLMKEYRQGILDGKYQPDEFGQFQSLNVLNDINEAETPEARKASQAIWLGMWKDGKLSNNGSLRDM